MVRIRNDTRSYRVSSKRQYVILLTIDQEMDAAGFPPADVHCTDKSSPDRIGPGRNPEMTG